MIKMFEKTKAKLKAMGREKLLKRIPPSISVLLIILTIVLNPGNAGLIGVAVLFGVLISFIPYSLYQYSENRRIKALEEQFPNFLRDLVEAKKSGMTLPQAVENTAKNEYGSLDDEIEKMVNQLSFNMPFEDVFRKFKERTQGSKLIQRSIQIIIEGKKSGGEVIATMETIASDASTIKQMEKEKKAKMQQHSMVMYIIYSMFVGIAIMLSKVLIPMTEMMNTTGEGQSIGITLGRGACMPLASTTGIEKFVCSFFISISKVFGMGTGLPGYYKGLFLSMILVEAIFSGLIIGQISNDSPASGIKHSLIMTGFGFAIFIASASLGII